MTLLDFLAFRKTPDTVYKFKICVTNVLSLQNINHNLNTIYEYISYEQGKSLSVCTQYFIDNELASSFSLIKDPCIENFFIKLIGTLNKENLKKLVVVNILTSKVCPIYSERLVAYNMEVDTFYIKFLTDNFCKDKMYRYATLLLFNLPVFSKFYKARLPYKIIQYINTSEDVEAFGMYMMFILKEQTNRRVYSLEYNNNIVQNINTVTNAASFYNLDSNISYVNFEDIKSVRKHEDYKDLDFRNKKVTYYRAILSLNAIDEITETIVHEFTEIFTNTHENIDFLKFLIKTYPFVIGKYMGTYKHHTNDWSVKEVYNTLISKTKESKTSNRYTPMKITGNFLQKIIDLEVKDEEIYFFVFFVNRKEFFTNFKNIERLMDDNLYFHGTIINLLLNK